MALPRNAHRVTPDTITMRILPCDVLGIVIDTALAILAALTFVPLFIIRDFTLGLATRVVEGVLLVLTASIDTGGETTEGVVVVDEVDVEEEVVVVVVVGTTLSDPTATALVSTRFPVFDPVWPMSFRPQHCNCPVSSTAQA